MRDLSVEVLPLGTVERECAERGEPVLSPADLDGLLTELRGSQRPTVGVESVVEVVD